MKVGNVSQTVLKRSVLKQLHTKRKEILTDLSVEEMCTAVQIRDTEDVVFASAVVSGNSKNIGVYAIMRAVLDLETRGASAIGVSVQVILPTYAYESRLKEMFRCMEERCASWGIAITCAKAETSPAVSQSVVSVTAAGSVEKGQLRTLAQAEPNQEIVLCGSIAAEGVLRIFDEKRAFKAVCSGIYASDPGDRIRTGGFPCASQCEAGKYTKRGTTGDCNAADWKRWNPGVSLGTDRGGKCGNAD